MGGEVLVAPVDEFHIRGREATLELAQRAAPAKAWFAATLARLKKSGPPPLGLHLLMGPTAPVKFANMLRNLEETRIAVWQAVAGRT